MWELVKHYAGRKIPVPGHPRGLELWFAVDKSEAEKDLSMRLRAALKIIRGELVLRNIIADGSDGWKRHISINWKTGIIYCRRDVNSNPIRLVERDRVTNKWSITDWPAYFLAGLEKRTVLDALNTAP